MKLYACAQNCALGTGTKFELEIFTLNVISGIVYFRDIILESSQIVSETTPWFLFMSTQCLAKWEKRQPFDLFVIGRDIAAKDRK